MGCMANFGIQLQEVIDFDRLMNKPDRTIQIVRTWV